MALPKFISDSRTPMDPGMGGKLGAAKKKPPAKGGPPPAVKLSFTIEKQKQAQWCWAAVSVSVARFYSPSTKWTQCSLVNIERGESSCCGASGADVPCNEPYYLDRSLERTGNLRDYLDRALDAAELRTELRGGAPLGCRIAWDAINGHFVVIDGFAEVGGVLHVDVEDPDPQYASSTYTFDSFIGSYRDTGFWSHSYPTKRAAVGGGASPLGLRKRRRPLSVSN
jgi:hypothetical protein